MHYAQTIEITRQRHLDLLEQARQDRLADIGRKQQNNRHRPGLLAELRSKVIG